MVTRILAFVALAACLSLSGCAAGLRVGDGGVGAGASIGPSAPVYYPAP